MYDSTIYLVIVGGASGDNYLFFVSVPCVLRLSFGVSLNLPSS